MYSIRDLTKFYGKQRAIDRLNLNFSSGMFLAILGRNGSGKSTLMRLLAQQDVYDQGDISFDGQSLESASLELNPHLCYVAEDQDLPLNDTIDEWSRHFGCEGYSRELFHHLCSSLGVDRTKSFHELSRGQKMKALFALQAPRRPRVYLLDEMTSVLDQGSRLALLQFLKSECDRGCLVIASTNIASEMQNFATDFLFMDDGRCALFCKTHEFTQHFRKVRLIASPNIDVDSIARAAGAKKAHLNSDGTWSYLVPADVTGETQMTDRRQITIEDVAAYFSTERSA